MDHALSKRLKIHVRVAVMLSLTLFMFFGPFYRQVLKGQNKYVPRWVMYSGAGLGVVRVEFFIEDYQGNRRKLDYFTTGGEEVYLISGMPSLDSMINNLKRKHRGDRALVVNARIATKRGWETIYDEERFDLKQK